MRYLTLALCLLLCHSLLTAQERCGISPQEAAQIKQRLMDNRAEVDRQLVQQFQQSRNTIYVPVAFHIVGMNDGSGYINESRVLDNLCTLNDHYAPQNVRFYLHNNSIYYMNNTVLYNHTSESGARIAMASAKKSNAVNIYIGNAAGSGGNGGIILGYYAPGSSLDYIFVIKDAVGGNETTITHETGHFFTLPHPFNGWEGQVYNPNQPTPTQVGFQNTLVEYQDGRNCTVSGDGFCDTKPNYNLGFSTTGCNYSGGAVDPDNVVIDPDEDNYMSYFNDACQTQFSNEQQLAIGTDIVARGWHTNITSNAGPIAASPTLTYPVQNQLAPLGVTLQWNAVANASGYVVELYENIAGIALQRILSTTTTTASYTVPASLMQDSRLYHWTVRPYNAYYTCTAGFSASADFISSLAANVESPSASLSTAEVFPNPSAAGNSRMKVESQQAQRADLRIVDINGRIVAAQQNLWLNDGPTILELPTAELAAGFYIVELQGRNGQLRKKLQIR